MWDLSSDNEVDSSFLKKVMTPARVPRRGQFASGTYVHIQFDGGSSRSSFATAGYVLVDATGKELVRRGIVLGPGQTNNDAESAAVALALEELARRQDRGEPHLACPIRVLGDS